MPVFACAPGCSGRTVFCFFKEVKSYPGGHHHYATHKEYAALLIPSLIALNLLCIFSVWLMGRGKVLMKY